MRKTIIKEQKPIITRKKNGNFKVKFKTIKREASFFEKNMIAYEEREKRKEEERHKRNKELQRKYSKNPTPKQAKSDKGFRTLVYIFMLAWIIVEIIKTVQI